jgi:hypothetical protein
VRLTIFVRGLNRGGAALVGVGAEATSAARELCLSEIMTIVSGDRGTPSNKRIFTLFVTMRVIINLNWSMIISMTQK